MEGLLKKLKTKNRATTIASEFMPPQNWNQYVEAISALHCSLQQWGNFRNNDKKKSWTRVSFKIKGMEVLLMIFYFSLFL
jgi:hypothetical protein